MTGQVPTPAAGRTLHLAILFGAFAFGAVVFYLTSTEGGLAATAMPELGLVADSMSVVALVTAMAMRAVFRRRAAAATGAERAQACLLAMLVPVAILEGAILFECVVWLLDGNPVPHAAVAGFLLLVAAAMPMPRPESFDVA